MLAHFDEPGLASNATLTLTEQPTVAGTSVTAGRFVSFNFPATFDNPKLDSINGVLNNEHGPSEKITTGNPHTFTLGSTPNHQDECAYLHMTPAPNSTLSCMGNAGVRDIVRRIPLPARFPDQNHDLLMAHEYDFLNFSRMSLRRVKFSLRFADGQLLPAIGQTNFSILFAVVD